MIRKLDHWIGTRLFHPPIIWLCQRAGMTQWAVAAYAWMAATFTLVMRVRFGSIGDIIFAVVISLIALLQTVGAALLPDMPRQPSFGFRLFIWAFTAVNVLDLAYSREIRPDLQWSLLWDAFALVGEYAKTIDRIPPRKRRERRTAAKEALA